jgi:hypothetical protein
LLFLHLGRLRNSGRHINRQYGAWHYPRKLGGRFRALLGGRLSCCPSGCLPAPRQPTIGCSPPGSSMIRELRRSRLASGSSRAVPWEAICTARCRPAACMGTPLTAAQRSVWQTTVQRWKRRCGSLKAPIAAAVAGRGAELSTMVQSLIMAPLRGKMAAPQHCRP